ncbi:MAG: FHA domain-containing protein [Deltaproteobacteria bacterium]|nr:FHA domain-containing protein [Deltaproteobacteria bacterium]
MAEELLLLSPAQIEAAANVGRLARLAERLVEERSWSSVDLLLSHATLDVVPLEELAAAARAVDRALARMPEARSQRPAIVREIAALRALAGRSLAKRLRHDPVTQQERPLLALAGELLMAAGDPKEAARLFERAHEDGRAADAYGATGDLEKMEACHERIERRRGARRAATQLTRKAETLIESGERVAALMLLEGAPYDLLIQAGLLQTRDHLQKHLCRGRTLNLRVRTGAALSCRFAGTPAVLGREAGVQVPLRDPGVSRRHAAIVSDGDDLAVEDANSRAGTTLGAARLVGRVPIRAATEVGLGPSCRLVIERVSGTDARAVHVKGLSGLDRAMRAIVGESPLDLAWAFPTAQGLMLNLEGGVARLERVASLPVRVAGQLVGRTCELLAGDLLELADSEGQPLVIEVLG